MKKLEQKEALTWVLILAVFTIAYNILEGLVSTYFGFQDESLVLFGFGVDSFVEVVSGFGILQMVLRIQKNPGSSKSKSEISALKITGYGFYVLVAGLVISSGIELFEKHKPETTSWGVVISLISIIVMLVLYRAKLYLGKLLQSDPIIADGRCTLVCIYMSIILLVSSLVYQITGFAWLDVLGSLGLAWFAYKEGQEAFEKAKGKECCCHC